MKEIPIQERAIRINFRAKRIATGYEHSPGETERMQLEDALMTHAARLSNAGVGAKDVNRTCYEIEQNYWNSERLERAAYLGFLQGIERTKSEEPIS